jgi:hypothetical protein
MLSDLTFPCYFTIFSGEKCLSGKVICTLYGPLLEVLLYFAHASSQTLEFGLLISPGLWCQEPHVRRRVLSRAPRPAESAKHWRHARCLYLPVRMPCTAQNFSATLGEMWGWKCSPMQLVTIIHLDCNLDMTP